MAPVCRCCHNCKNMYAYVGDTHTPTHAPVQQCVQVQNAVASVVKSAWVREGDFKDTAVLVCNTFPTVIDKNNTFCTHTHTHEKTATCFSPWKSGSSDSMENPLTHSGGKSYTALQMITKFTYTKTLTHRWTDSGVVFSISPPQMPSSALLLIFYLILPQQLLTTIHASKAI